jgi:opacity protein-like surface antigen
MSAAFAQDVDTIAVPLVEASAGYVFMRDVSNEELTDVDHVNFPAGWYAAGAFNPTEWLGLVGEVSASYRNDLEFTMFGVPSLTASKDARLYTVLGGLRFFRKVGRVVPFVQVLTGLARVRSKTTGPDVISIAFSPGNSAPEVRLGSDTVREETDNNFAIQPGGGVTVYLTENLGVRLAGDYRSMIDFNSFGNGTHYNNQFRAMSGFTLHWGAR